MTNLKDDLRKDTNMNTDVKLSIVILCWNDRKVIQDCLRSIYVGTRSVGFEIIVSDNGSTDGSLEMIRKEFPDVRVVENGANLGFAKGNNAGIRLSAGEYVLVLNPDTIVENGALDRWVAFADCHPEAGAFGCRVLNPDGSFQNPARPFPTIWRTWVAALYLRPLAHVSNLFLADVYTGWAGTSEREIDWQSGCCVMFRADVLHRLNGFDEQFFYTKEEVDLCFRVHKAGYSILYTPEPAVIHLGGQSVGRFPIRFAIEEYRSAYRYFYKHYGAAATCQLKTASMVKLRVRQLGYGLLNLLRSSDVLRRRLDMYKACTDWNGSLDPLRFVERGEEPTLQSNTV